MARAICPRVDEWNYGGLESGSAIKRRIDNPSLPLFLLVSLANDDRKFIRTTVETGARFRNRNGQWAVHLG